ncbi:MAG: hypothetical protein V1865_00100 [bacterium]
MALRGQNKKLIIRFIFLIFVVAGFAGIFYYNQTVSDQYNTNTESSAPVEKKFAGKDFDTDILESEKFKELKEIPLKDQVSTGLEAEGELTADELAKLKLMARYGNPFQPF